MKKWIPKNTIPNNIIPMNRIPKKTTGILLPMLILCAGLIWFLVSISLHEAWDRYLSVAIPGLTVTAALMFAVSKLKGNRAFTLCLVFLLNAGIVFQALVKEVGSSHLMAIYLVTPIAGGMGAALLIFFVDHFRSVHRIPLLFGVICLLNLITLCFGTGEGEVRAWISIGGFMFQITDLTKLITIIYWGIVLMDPGRSEKSRVKGCLLGWGVDAVCLVCISEFGTLLVLTGTLGILFFLYVRNLRVFLIFLGAVVLGILFAWLTVSKVRERVGIWRSPESDPQDKGYQLLQSLKAIRLGGLFGDHEYLVDIPFLHTDSAFAAFVNRMGALMGLLLISAYGLLFKFGFTEGADRKGVIGNGLLSAMLFSTLFSMAGSFGLLPVVGLPMAFVSYGGTNLVISFITVFYLIMIQAEGMERIRYNVELGLGRRAELSRIRKGE